jgi:DNA polymerase (family 10)
VDKGQVAAVLEDVGNLLELTGGNPFEARAYQNAARTLSGLEGDIEESVRTKAIERVPGLGKTLVARVTELVTTGHMAFYDELQAKVPPGLRQMLRIPGLGPKRVKQLYDSLNISTLDALKSAAETGQIATLPGFGAKSQEKILQGIGFLAEHQDKFRYDVAVTAAKAIFEQLRALPQIVRIAVAGSIRRHKEVCKDMDLVASVARDEDRMPIMNALVSLPEVASVTGTGETKTSVVLKMGMALDLRVVLDDDYPFLLHHFTGSKEHNVALRTYFHPRGIKISEYGIFRGDQLIPCKDEVDIYRALGMQYVEPELREDTGEIQVARENKLPTLVTEDDLRGILHVHSTWSDGGATIHEMAEAARAMGMRYLGMCDHSQAAAYANGLSPANVRRQQEEIDRLNDEYAGKFRILKGTECDILKDGALDYDDKTLASFDFVVASIHSHFELPPAEQTTRLIRALENPYLSILGHPTGRILLERPGYDPDLEAVIDRAGELGACIEINADPHRFDLDWRFHRRATERGIRIPICPDAHSPAGLRNITYGIGIARKGWLTRADVLNCLPTDDILAFFTQQRAKRGA